jgi:hypothetical protein
MSVPRKRKSRGKKPRDYRREYETYHGKPENIKKRVATDQARRKMQKKLGVKKLKGDVHHKDHNPHNKSYSNLVVMSPSRNRSDNLGRGGRPKKRTKKS